MSANTSKLILIVDDDKLVLAMLEQMLKREGYKTCLANNGREAMIHVQEKQPDLVITDLIMPEKEGLELIRELKKSQKNLRIVAISGGARSISPHQNLQIAGFFGADLSFPKPIDRRPFLASIRSLLED